MLPLPQRCALPAHEKATLSLSLLPLPWPLPLRLLSPLLSQSPSPSPSLLTSLLPLPSAVAVGHCRHGRHCLLPQPSPSYPCHPLPLLLPLLLAIAVSVTVGHHSYHLRWPSLLPLPLAISESCCLGMARIVFEQFKQIMLILFYFVWTVGGALIKARCLTRHQAAMANTSIGGKSGKQQAASGRSG